MTDHLPHKEQEKLVMLLSSDQGDKQKTHGEGGD